MSCFGFDRTTHIRYCVEYVIDLKVSFCLMCVTIIIVIINFFFYTIGKVKIFHFQGHMPIVWVFGVTLNVKLITFNDGYYNNCVTQ